jgi:agmatine deiminase
MAEKKITIGLIQSVALRDIDKNLQNTMEKIAQAAEKGAQIICLQELFLTFYFPQDEKNDVSRLAEFIPGKTTEKLSTLAKKLKVAVIVPLYEKDIKGNYYNSATVIDADGKISGVYRKSHIPFDPLFYEKNYFSEGDSGYPVFHTQYADISVLICYDQWFPEAARASVLRGAEIIFYPTAIGWTKDYNAKGENWHDAWETIQRGHAIANGAHVASVNRVGRERGIQFWGGSFVCDSFGKMLKKASQNKEEILIAEMDLTMNQRIQEDWGFLKNRRPEFYQILCKKKLP